MGERQDDVTNGERAAATALVLFSGGQDSTTCLAYALANFDHVETIGFDYGQRHRVELDLRANLRDALVKIRPLWAPRLGADHCLDLTIIAGLATTAMTHDVAIAFDERG